MQGALGAKLSNIAEEDGRAAAAPRVCAHFVSAGLLWSREVGLRSPGAAVACYNALQSRVRIIAARSIATQAWKSLQESDMSKESSKEILTLASHTRSLPLAGECAAACTV